MRTPKYRVYIKHWGNSENNGLIYPKEGTLHIYMGNWEVGGYKEAVFQQFTELKDTNDVDAYEGDIIQYHRACEKLHKVITYTSIIEFKEGMFGFTMLGFNDMFTNLSEEHFRIIGNIFETPELLKNENN